MANASSNSPQSVLDREAALSRVGGDDELLHEIAQIFLDDYPRSLAELREAAGRGDARTVERAAHGLKGAAANFGARPVVDAALAIETMGRHQDLSGFSAALGALEQTLSRFRHELEEL
jgi:two-component system, sensor histidine kinase and response regulator